MCPISQWFCWYSLSVFIGFKDKNLALGPRAATSDISEAQVIGQDGESLLENCSTITTLFVEGSLRA